MVWKEWSRVDERMLLIGEYVKGGRAMTELCREFGVSRKTAYKWVARYSEDGPAGLADKSRAPLSHPARLDPVVVEAALQARRAHPHWGARKILAWLLRKQPQFDSPAVSTVSAIFAKYGLSRTSSTRAAVRRLIQIRSAMPVHPINSGARTSRATSGLATGGAAIR